VWSIYLGNVPLGRLDERTYVIHGKPHTKSVTHVPGLFCYASSRLLTAAPPPTAGGLRVVPQ
jgi:hypothetical protein